MGSQAARDWSAESKVLPWRNGTRAGREGGGMDAVGCARNCRLSRASAAAAEVFAHSHGRRKGPLPYCPLQNQSNAKKGLRRRAAVGNVRDGEVYCAPLSLAAPPETQIDRNLSPLPAQNECTHRLSGRTVKGSVICTTYGRSTHSMVRESVTGRGGFGVSSRLGPFQRAPTWCHLLWAEKQGSEMAWHGMACGRLCHCWAHCSN